MAISLAVAGALLKKPIEDLYDLAKQKLGNKFCELQNEDKYKKIAQKISAYDKVRTIWQKSKDVRITQMYYPPRIETLDGNLIEINSLDKIPRHKNYVIEGTVGQGKSIFLRYLCLQELSNNSTGRIPLFIELRTLEKYGSLKNSIINSLENLGFTISDEIYEIYISSGKLVLLLDGFDELPANLNISIMEELESFSLQYPELQILVTSRPNRDIQKSVRFEILLISPLKPDDFDPFLKKINVPTQLRSQLLSALSTDSAKISELLTTPLMLTLAAYVYRAEREIPAELPQFFEILFQTVFTAHDKTKIAFTRECKSGLDESSLQRLFEGFCFMAMQDGNLRSLKPSNFESAYTKILQYFKHSCKLSDFKHDIVQVACLMQTEGYDTTFIHQSVQEYYAASFIKHCINEVAKRFYETADLSFDHRWFQVLNFLSHIDEYRWAKYFKLPQLLTGKKILEDLKLEGNFKLLFHDKHVHYSFVDNKLSIDGFEVHDYKNYEIDNFYNTLIFLILGHINSTDKNLIVEIASKTSPIQPSSKVVKITSLISHTPNIEIKLKNIVDKKLSEINNEIIRIQKIISIEESKINIFDLV